MKKKSKKIISIIIGSAILLIIVILAAIFFTQFSAPNLAFADEPTTVFQVTYDNEVWDGESVPIHIFKGGLGSATDADDALYAYLLPLKKQFDSYFNYKDIIPGKSKCTVTLSFGRCFQNANNIGCFGLSNDLVPQPTVLTGTLQLTDSLNVQAWSCCEGRGRGFYITPYKCVLNQPYPIEQVYAIAKITEPNLGTLELYKSVTIDIQLEKYIKPECETNSDCAQSGCFGTMCVSGKCVEKMAMIAPPVCIFGKAIFENCVWKCHTNFMLFVVISIIILLLTIGSVLLLSKKHKK